MSVTEPAKLTPEERGALWRQYAQVHAKVQETFDSSVRTLAAAGIAVTVTIATAAVESFNRWGVATVVALLLCLGCNVLSYVTAQKDMRRRLEFVREYDLRGFDETRWTTGTFWLNVLAGTLLLVGGGLLAAFVSSSL